MYCAYKQSVFWILCIHMAIHVYEYGINEGRGRGWRGPGEGYSDIFIKT